MLSLARIVLTSWVISTGCVAIDWPEQQAHKQSMGEAIFDITRAQIENSSICTSERLAILDQEQEDFTQAIDNIFAESVGKDLRTTIQRHIIPLVDSDELPQFTSSLAETLSWLIDSDFDPEHQALQSLLTAAQSNHILYSGYIIEFFYLLLSQPDATDILRAFLKSAQSHDGVDFRINTLLNVIKHALSTAVAKPDFTPFTEYSPLPTTIRSFLKPWEDSATTDTHDPVWTVWADENSNPQVAIDPQSGNLYSPFRDLNQDLVADTNIHGFPVDAMGNSIQLAPFGAKIEANRDYSGRALAYDQSPLYNYFDAQKTLLNSIFQIWAEAISKKVDHDLALLLHTILGEPQPCPESSTACQVYAPKTHLVADIVFLGLELFQYEHVHRLLKTWQTIIQSDHRLASSVLALSGQTLKALNEKYIFLSDPNSVDQLKQSLPLLRDILSQSNTSGRSTARLLLSMINDLAMDTQNLPLQFAHVLKYINLVKDVPCSAENPDFEASLKVDFSQPRYIEKTPNNRIDNRSAFEQVIELLAASNTCVIPFTEKSIAHMLVEILADQTPENACFLIESFLDILDIHEFSETAVTWSFNLMGCPGELIWDNLQALDHLAKSGVLTAYIPLSKIFIDQGQTSTLLSFNHLLNQDLKQDEDNNPATVSHLRRLEVSLINILESDVPHTLAELLKLLLNYSVPNTTDSAADVFIDALENLLATKASINTRLGPMPNTSFALTMLNAYHDILLRVADTSKQNHLRAVVDFVGEYFSQSQWDNNQNSGSEDYPIVLNNQRAIYLIEGITRILSEMLPYNTTVRTEAIQHAQHQFNRYFTGSEFASLIRLGQHQPPAVVHAIAESALIRLLQPVANSTAINLFHPFLQISASALQNVSLGYHDALLRYFLKIFDPSLFDRSRFLSSLERLLEHENSPILLQLCRQALSQNTVLGQTAPAAVLIHIAKRIADLRKDQQCQSPTTYEQKLKNAEIWVQQIMNFLTDEENGLGAVYRIIRARQVK